MNSKRDGYTKYEEIAINFLLSKGSQSLDMFLLMVIYSSKQTAVFMWRVCLLLNKREKILEVTNIKREAEND